MKRIILIGAAALVAIVVVATVMLYSSLDAIVKAAIEKIGSDVTGTRVRVNDVDISVASGQGVLRGFRVTNPEGFEKDDAFQFDEITMKIDLATLASDTVVIEELVVQGPRIRYEFGGKGTNVGEIQKNVDGYSAGSAPGAGPSFIIEHLYFRDGEVNVAGAQILKQGVTTPLPDVHLTNIGSEEGGATPAVVSKKVMGALGGTIKSAVASLNLGELGRQAGDVVQVGAENTKEAAKKAGKKLGELLGKD